MADTNTPGTDGADPAQSELYLHGVRTSVGPTGFRHTYTMTCPDYDRLNQIASNLRTGCYQEIDGPEDSKYSGVIATGESQRTPGGGQLSVVFVAPPMVEYWGVEPSEVQKSIKTWKADDKTDPPKLEQISRWESLQTSDWESYISYKWDGSEVMTGNTLKLARMIHEWGIQSYTVHTPIAFRNTTWIEFPADLLKGLDLPDTPTSREGWAQSGAASGLWTSEKVAGLAKKWIKSDDRAIPNADGTWSRSEQWTGADELCPYLYPESPAPQDSKGAL